MKQNTHIKIHASLIESKARDQVDLIATNPAITGLVAIMPDVHAGAGCDRHLGSPPSSRIGIDSTIMGETVSKVNSFDERRDLQPRTRPHDVP